MTPTGYLLLGVGIGAVGYHVVLGPRGTRTANPEGNALADQLSQLPELARAELTRLMQSGAEVCYRTIRDGFEVLIRGADDELVPVAATGPDGWVAEELIEGRL